MKNAEPLTELSFEPLTDHRWPDLLALFGERGACGGCWCMYWRLTSPQFERNKGQANRDALRGLAATDPAPGLIAYVDGRPAGWCAVAPRHEYPRLERSRTLKRLDDKPVWSISCLFIARPYRRAGLSVALIKAAAGYAFRQGAPVVEAYPVIPTGSRVPDVFAWTGLLAAYEKAGFTECARPSSTRAIMRCEPAAGQ